MRFHGGWRTGLSAAFAVAATSLACGEREPPTGSGTQAACPTERAATECERVTWPRLVVAFGDSGARALSYAFVVDGALVRQSAMCIDGHGASSSLHCDLPFFSYPAMTPLIRLEVAATEGGPILLSRDIALKPFNYCGNGVAQIVVSMADAGVPTAGEVTYIDICSL